VKVWVVERRDHGALAVFSSKEAADAFIKKTSKAYSSEVTAFDFIVDKEAA